MEQVYLDHSATTPVDPAVFDAMIPYYKDWFGNPSSVHQAGQAARRAVEESRAKVASLINASPEEIVFTGSGTEADNQAVIGYARNHLKPGDHIITSSIEHHAVLDAVESLKQFGYETTLLPVDSYGLVSPAALRDAIRPNTKLVSVMHTNNEIGTIEPIQALAAIAHERGAVFHTDAVQSVGRIPVDVKALGVDMLSASAHKLYGPKGVGMLYIRKGFKPGRYLIGGAQERNRRAGTENVAGIVGFAKAAELAQANMAEVSERLTRLGSKLIEGLTAGITESMLTGHPEQRLPGHVSFCFRYIEGESILLLLDQFGIMASSGSACTSGSLDPSHVLLAIGLPHEIAHGSVRLTMGKGTTEEQVDYVLQTLPPIVERLRNMSPLTAKGR
ncbi:MAG: cysteine desulfurase NifS [Solirubrobacterales bacterium]